MASARPGADRSSTASVPSGVRSVGANPVPPAVTTSPWNPSASRPQRRRHRSRRRQGRHPSPATTNPWSSRKATSRGPVRSSRPPAWTESDTVTTLASCTGSRVPEPGRDRPGAVDRRPTRGTVGRWASCGAGSRCRRRVAEVTASVSRPSAPRHRAGVDARRASPSWGRPSPTATTGPRVPVPVLVDVTFTVPRDGYAALVGPSGAGKTTLLVTDRRSRAGPDRDPVGRRPGCRARSRGTSSPRTAGRPWGSSSRTSACSRP